MARFAILGYIEDGPNLVIPAMNGWADPEPGWWLNLQSDPDVTVELPGGTRTVTARAAVGEERSRLWAKLVGLGTAAYTDANAALRSRETAVVVLEPRREQI
jgi:deazaflavin-dependent oxidoreductase (nitroreductase family)